MRRLAFLATSALLAVTSFAAPAHAAGPPAVTGLTCGLVSTSDPVGLILNPDAQIGPLWGGPVVSTSGPVTILCTVQVGGTGVHSEPDFPGSVSSGSGNPVAVAAPQVVIYTALAVDPVWVCTAIVAADGTTWYYDAATGSLSNDPTGAQCDLAISQLVPPYEVCDATPLCDVVDRLCAKVNNRPCTFPADVRASLPRVFTTLV